MIIFWIALLSGSLLFGVYHLMVSKRRYNWSKKWQRASSITAMDEKPAFGVTADPQRKWGTWIPHPFVTPVPAPYPNWSVAHTKPLPYRPFKHNYFVTMGIRSMSWDDWIELDNEWPEFHARKMNRIQERADKLNHTEPCAVLPSKSLWMNSPATSLADTPVFSSSHLLELCLTCILEKSLT